VRFLTESVWNVKKSLEGVGSGLELRAGMLGDVVRELLAGYRDIDAKVVGVWMTSEEGIEEKREEREVRQAAEKSGVDFKIWVDEKYYIDE
jgi:deoxyribodipyrimidine photo-lyase